MIDNFEMYVDFGNELFKKLPVMKTEQLRRYIGNYFCLEDERADTIMFGLQRVGVFMLSTDGWALTKGMYQKMTCDRFKEHVVYGGCYQLADMDEFCSKYKPAVIKAFWLVVDLLPDSHNFTVTDNCPYQLMWTADPDPERNLLARLFQVCCVEKGFEIITPEILRSALPVQDKLTRQYMRRIILLDEEKSAWRYPNVGISNICRYDDTLPKHYSIIEHRDASVRWSAYD